MKKRNDGQVSLAAESDEEVYEALKALCTRVSSSEMSTGIGLWLVT